VDRAHQPCMIVLTQRDKLSVHRIVQLRSWPSQERGDEGKCAGRKGHVVGRDVRDHSLVCAGVSVVVTVFHVEFDIGHVSQV
jgi:hypothetical protein